VKPRSEAFVGQALRFENRYENSFLAIWYILVQHLPPLIRDIEAVEKPQTDVVAQT